MKRKYTVFVLALTLLVFSSGISGIACAADSQPEKVSQIYAFGDSLSDNGDSLAISKRIMAMPEKPAEAFLLPSDPAANLYWEGRWSNGPTAVEVLAEKLAVPLTDYAVGGAESGEGNYYTWLDGIQHTGVLGQTAEFTKSLNGKAADPDALYFICISANDYFYHMDYQTPGSNTSLAAVSVDNIVSAVTTLAASGAEDFLVTGSFDLAAMPWEGMNSRTTEAAIFTDAVNAGLQEKLPAIEKNLNIDIDYFDLVAATDEIRNNPAEHGLKEINKPYELTYPEVKPGTGNPDEYFFWDEWHPTKAVHKILGEEMYKTLELSAE